MRFYILTSRSKGSIPTQVRIPAVPLQTAYSIIRSFAEASNRTLLQSNMVPADEWSVPTIRGTRKGEAVYLTTDDDLEPDVFYYIVESVNGLGVPVALKGH